MSTNGLGANAGIVAGQLYASINGGAVVVRTVGVRESVNIISRKAAARIVKALAYVRMASVASSAKTAVRWRPESRHGSVEKFWEGGRETDASIVTKL